MDSRIEIKNLNQYYGKKQVLHEITLTIERGMFGLLGPNGAGKTTLMKTLSTLLPLTDGQVKVCGIPLKEAKEIRKITGYLPQDFSMYPSMSVGEVMDYLGVLSGMPGDERRKRIPMLLDQVNLAEEEKKKVKALSGGMKRRLGIAQALLHDPKVLIVDEPTAGLDPEERIRFRNLLGDVAKDRIVILSTHIVGDVEASCENIGILDKGSLLFWGTVEELLENAENKVYEIDTDKRTLEELKQQYLVTSVKPRGRSMHVRLLSKQPVEGADLCEPHMEDAYLFCLHENGADLRKGEVELSCCI